ncbi:MAG: iron ABC transporter permease [Candidatus Nanopelagicales bacterium]|nr:iron ABC transporter permease [Actinomycetota bacterium]MBT5502128.1 iron ABC transporter permease [Actinomycetota bacterium]MBT5806775.1 iron ABC transporter permease [Actinomycetota bacterium]
MKNPGRSWIVGIALFITLSVLIAVSLNFGAASTDSVVIWNIRLPRTIAATLVGVGLASAGVLLQGSLRNPLADPALVGVSAGAALGAVLGAAIGLPFNSIGVTSVAVVTSSIAMAFVLWVSRSNGRIEVVTVLLSGIAVSAFGAAAMSIIINSASNAAGTRSVSFWTTGSFSLSNWSGVNAMWPAIAIGMVLAFFLAPSLDLLALGDEGAHASGVAVSRVRALALLAAVLLTAAGVAVVGVIAFVGLVVPHAVRLVIGPSHRQLLVVSAVGGAVVLLLADTIARLALSPIEIPVGSVTAIVGAPVFFVMLGRARNRQGGWA